MSGKEIFFLNKQKYTVWIQVPLFYQAKMSLIVSLTQREIPFIQTPHEHNKTHQQSWVFLPQLPLFGWNKSSVLWCTMWKYSVSTRSFRPPVMFDSIHLHLPCLLVPGVTVLVRAAVNPLHYPRRQSGIWVLLPTVTPPILQIIGALGSFTNCDTC